MSLLTGFSLNPVWLKVTPELTSCQKQVYAELLRYLGKNKFAYPSIHTIGRELAISVRAVRMAVRKFEEVGLLRVEHYHGKASRYFLLEHVWQLRDHKWAKDRAKVHRDASHTRATHASEARADAREEASPSPWKTSAHPGNSDPGGHLSDPGTDCRGATFPTPANGAAPTPANGAALTPAKFADNEENSFEENIFEERGNSLSPTLRLATVPEASETARPTQRSDRPPVRTTDRTTDRPSPGSGSPPPPPVRAVEPLPAKSQPVTPLEAKARTAAQQDRLKAIAKVEQVWRAEMAKHYPQVPLGHRQWPTVGKDGLLVEPTKSCEAKNVLALVDDYGLEATLAYVRWIITNWKAVTKRYEKTLNFPATPNTLQAEWKVKDLMPEAQGAAGSMTATQQVRTLKDKLAAWYTEHPGELPPDDLAMETWRAPKLKGDKI